MKNAKSFMAAFAAIVMTFSAAAPAYAVSDGGVTAAEVGASFSESKPYEDGEHEGVFVSEDGFIYGPEKFAEGTCRVIDYIGDKADIVIPKEIDGYKVTSIKSYFEDDYMTAQAFLLNDRLKSVTILADIESISDNSFYGCKNLEKVVLPETLKRTGSRVFADCTALESIDLPNGLEYVGDRFAWDSKWLAAREKSEKLVVICGRLISGRKAKGKVTVPANVSDIAGYAFNGCKGMTELVIPGTCKGIGEGSINDCPKLKKVTLKNGVKGVSNLGAIHDCPAVEKIVLPPSLDRENAGYMIWEYNNHATYYYYKGTGAEKAVKKALKTIKTIKGSVLPGKTKSLKLTASKGRIKVTWQTVSTAGGYQIKISPDKTFKNGVTTRFVKDKNTKSIVFKKLGSGKKYYVRMRTYRTISGRKYYGNYTKVRAAVVK
ncbi:leucine-rich repeat domain-containing protein [Ruminococcus sp.]|uniref:leucine-rich repeat domain-containing protein n=1 Tax=Ruminococcus sp. TaxID=41978 RepID=UPI002586E8F4|nr:leucine-rich repeat domain-containing protein [Ruminococcus sp.]MCR5021765.1 leucine-rich repeat domain-containing protein [Ruminococcus sp.]